jgi:hypothetical protein
MAVSRLELVGAWFAAVQVEAASAPTRALPQPLDHLRALAAPASHPVGFYRRVGFAVSGIVPDANGRGLPGILLARRLG